MGTPVGAGASKARGLNPDIYRVSFVKPASSKQPVARPDSKTQLHIPRMLAFDIDGTLLRNDGSLSQRVIDCIGELRDRGFILTVATGRPWLATRDVIEALGAMMYAVCLNGTVVMDVPTNQLLQARAMSTQQACDTARLARRLLPGVRLAADLSDGRHIWDHGFATEMPETMLIEINRVANAEEVVYQEGVEVLTWLVEQEGAMISGTDLNAGYRDIYQDAEHIIATLSPEIEPGLAVRHSGIGPAEIGLAGVSKASALEWIANEHDISSVDVMAFGDGFNDVEMLTWAGQSFAMANATPEVRGYANRVTLDNEADGVAVVLEELLAELSTEQ